MNEDTRKLLQECASGCKMALDSMTQLEDKIEDKKFFELVQSYKEKHKNLEIEAVKKLEYAGNEDKGPGVMATTFSRVSTEMKLMMKGDDKQIAKVLMDGCNMGIQSVAKYQNEYQAADKESLEIARKLVKLEEDLMQEMKAYL
jgi:hypothetical protein